jgi:hypothetical protein
VPWGWFSRRRFASITAPPDQPAARTTISPSSWVTSLGGRRRGNRHGLGLALGQDVAATLVYSRILDLHPTAALHPVTELEQSGVEL